MTYVDARCSDFRPFFDDETKLDQVPRLDGILKDQTSAGGTT